MPRSAPASVGSTADGWLLDVTESSDGRSVVRWVKDRATGRVASSSVPFRPPFYVAAPPGERAALRRHLAAVPEIDEVEERSERPSLFDSRPQRLLRIVPRSNRQRRRLAEAIDRRGKFHRFTLYDVDLAPSQLYFLQHELYPFAPVGASNGELRASEPAEKVDCEFPPLRTVQLEVRWGEGRAARLPTGEGRIVSLRLGEELWRGEEESMVRELPDAIARLDPDVIFTAGGDSLDLPGLYRRASELGLPDAQFFLGREASSFRATRPARSFASYGRTLHSAAAFNLPGRFHIDRENSFLFGDADLHGLIDAARLSRLSLQNVVRQSPGTCFSAMEVAEAIRLGVRIPWKKNRPERFRTAEHLVAADRGGTIFLPPVGVHDRVDEFDFASLFPHIMVRRNLSAETLDCRCCPQSPIVAPGLGYRSCTKRIGLIPRTLRPLLERRLALKAALRRPDLSPAARESASRRVKTLKWILVTAFGYQGYRNARFGRIECHEAINAYARELLAGLSRTAEDRGYQVLHGLVDSLWLRSRAESTTSEGEAFARAMSERYDLPLSYEGRYRWIVFLPAVGRGLGVPNRYYGCYESGEFKLRGIGSRRHDTPGIVRRLEGELLHLFAGARTAAELRTLIPGALARVDRFAERLAEGEWPLEELVIRRRTTASVEEYSTFGDTVSALEQAAALGLDRSAGESVRYVMLDRGSHAWRDRARLAEALHGDERYDRGAYLELLARFTEGMLAPFGVTRAGLLSRWDAPASPHPSRYRSGARRSQSLLGEDGDGRRL